jgi:hypothetical protein
MPEAMKRYVPFLLFLRAYTDVVHLTEKGMLEIRFAYRSIPPTEGSG